jgi:hypothetical protein
MIHLRRGVLWCAELRRSSTTAVSGLRRGYGCMQCQCNIASISAESITLPRVGGCEEMEDLLEEMQQCKSVKACIELALTDAYGEYEHASAWLTCIEEMFCRFDRVRLMGEEVALEGLDLENLTVVAVCRKGKRRARVALDSVEFPGITPIEGRWLKAWKQFSRGPA